MTMSFYKDIYEMLSKKYPNRKIYTISDHHFFHSKIIEYSRPQFGDVIEMNEYIVKCHNEIIGSDDIVIFLGDFCFKNSLIKSFLSRMNGHKYLLLGNHDKLGLAKRYGELGLEGVFTTPVKIQDAYLSHQPLEKSEENDIHFKLLVKSFNSNPNGYNYHGHIHTTERTPSPFYNVTCEALGYKPILIGYTGGMLKPADSPLIITSDRFQEILHVLREEKNLDPTLLLTDYIYSMMLESNSQYAGSCFIYGSFPLYKKFGYVSNFSDLDVALIYNDSISKNRNSQRLKETVDRMYASVRDIEGINISFIKRIVNMCAFEAMYANKNGFWANCILDANLIPYNLYRESDFVLTHDCTTIEKALKKDFPDLANEIILPSYKAQYLTASGDMSNLILQILFQKGFDNKKNLAIKKLKYIFKYFGNNELENPNELEDVLIRFFLRNILFFYTLRRFNEIDYIKDNNNNVNKLLSSLPVGLAIPLSNILLNPSSDFNIVLKELSSVNIDEIPMVIPELSKIKKI